MRFAPLFAATAALLVASPALARDPIAAGSSTVAPFASAVVERANKKCNMNMSYESIGTGGGFKKFCAGVGEEHSDFAGASRAIKSSEKEDCAKNGVNNIVEINLGFDGIVLANSKSGKSLDISRADLFRALSQTVMQNGQMVPNPFQKWSDVNPGLPATQIVVIGPPPTSGTRDAFKELVMHAGCSSIPEYKAAAESDKKFVENNCSNMRQDGAYIEAGENDNLIVQRLRNEPGTYGIFGYSFLEENQATLQGALIDNVPPSFQTISDGSYPVSRPLFMYAKGEHMSVIPNMGCFITELTSEEAFGDEGYLTDIGLIPLDQSARDAARTAAMAK